MIKKNNIILTIAIIILIALITFLLINNKNETKGLKEITYKEVLKKIDKKEDFIILLSQTTCSHCAEYKPALKQIARKYDLTIYYLDYDKYGEKKAEEIIKFFNFDGDTPTTFFYKNGKETSVMNRLIGTVSNSKVISAIKKLEYIENE